MATSSTPRPCSHSASPSRPAWWLAKRRSSRPSGVIAHPTTIFLCTSKPAHLSRIGRTLLHLLCFVGRLGRRSWRYQSFPCVLISHPRWRHVMVPADPRLRFGTRSRHQNPASSQPSPPPTHFHRSWWRPGPASLVWGQIGQLGRAPRDLPLTDPLHELPLL